MEWPPSGTIVAVRIVPVGTRPAVGSPGRHVQCELGCRAMLGPTWCVIAAKSTAATRRLGV